MSASPLTFGFEFAVGGAHPALPGHFPGRPVVPGVLLLGQVLSGVAAELGRPVSALKQIKFAAPMLPDETATVVCEVSDDTLRFSVRASRAGSLVTLAAGTLQFASPPPFAGPARPGRSVPA